MGISGIDWMVKLPVSGVHTVTTADVTANKAEINTGKADAAGFVAQVLRGGIVTGSAKASITAGVLKIETNGTTYVLTAGDVISYIVF